ncbi:MAG: hypothetical protein CR984_04110 [Proteobacteria bacterium]|nr:MAG: hypothetical protein CR984_04110 [Pseudomonadota bacterium]PIE66842.1 MAG: hypothetical protein CSA23_07160 [Deltaproteobacteria bacterium]
MRTKQRITLLFIAFMGIALVSTPALAGSKQRHRWEGVAIGIGAAILGHAIYEAHNNHKQPSPVVYVEPGHPCRHKRGHRQRYGHWEWRKTWVPPTFERVWNPGHYNRRGQWIQGHWMKVKESEGHWVRERIWVTG